MTIIKRLSTAFTGDQSNVPLLLPAAGAVGYANRWFASDQAGAEGAALATLTGSPGTTAVMAQPTGTKQPTMHIESSQKMIRFDGTDDDMETGQSIATVKTVTAIVRINNPVGAYKGLMNTGQGALFRNSSTPGGVELTYSGGTAVTLAQPMNDSKFHVITAVGDNANSIRALAADSLYAAATGTTGNELVRLGRTGGSGYGQVDYLEVITWPYALTQAQCLAVYQAAKRNYPLFVA